jgi:hypothetical protein
MSEASSWCGYAVRRELRVGEARCNSVTKKAYVLTISDERDEAAVRYPEAPLRKIEINLGPFPSRHRGEEVEVRQKLAKQILTYETSAGDGRLRGTSLPALTQ